MKGLRRPAFLNVVIAAASVGCGSTRGGNSIGVSDAAVPNCNAPAVQSALYDGAANGPVGGLFLWNQQVLFSSSEGLFSVPLGGGSVVPIASGARGLGVVGGTLYYSADTTSSQGSQGRPSTTSALYAAPFAGAGLAGADGGSATLIQDNFVAGPMATDGTSLYAAPSALGAILKITPPDNSPVSLSVGGTLSVRSLAVGATYLYAAAEDLSTAPAMGAIVRMPKSGGSPDKILTFAGLPDALVVDDQSLYWIEGPAVGTFGNSHIARSDLDGKNESTLVGDRMSSQGAIALGPAHLYFLSDVLARVPKAGGPPETIVSALTGAGLLNVSGSDVVWVQNYNSALSSTAPTPIEALCVR